MRNKLLLLLVVLSILGAVARHFTTKEKKSERDQSELNRIAGIYRDKDFDKALTEIGSYLDKYPKDDLAWTIKGNILEDKDLDSEAEASYQTALSLNKDNFQAVNAMGVLARKRGDYDTAMAHYQRALELKPGYAQAYSSMAVIELKRKNDAEAVRLAELAYQNDNKDPGIAANLAVVCHYNGEIEKRDKFTAAAKELGYHNMDTLHKIYSGELTVRDE